MSSSRLNARKYRQQFGNRSRVLIPASVIGLFAAAGVTRAANDFTWTGSASPATTWSNSVANWVPTAGGAASAWLNGTSDIARFNSANHGTTISVGQVKLSFISFENSPASYTFNNGLFNMSSGNITLQSSAQNLSGGASAVETLNTPVSFITTSYAFTNNDADPNASLNFNGAIGAQNTTTQTTLALNGTGTGINTIGGIVSNGTAGFKLGVTINAPANNATIWKFTGANTYTGITSLAGGTLIVANATGSATGSGSVQLNAGTLASGTVGSIAGTVTAGSGPNLVAPGGVGTIGSLTFNGAFNTSGASTNLTSINFDLGAGPAVAGIISNGDLLNLNAASNIASGTALTFGGTPTPGNDYRLFGGTAVSGINLANFTLPTAPTGDTFSLSSSVDSGFIDLVVGTTATGPSSLTWDNSGTGGGDGVTWNTSQANWNNGTGNAVAYSNVSNTSTGDIVTFNDANNGHYNVAISGVVSPTFTTFNNSTGNYNVSGANASSGISGSGSFTKLGTGIVTLSSSNTYTGGTLVQAGTLMLTSAKAFPVNSGLNVSAGASVVIGNHGSNYTTTAYVPVMSSLNNNGTIDLTNNALVVRNGSIGTISSQVALAYNGGQWNGTTTSSGIITSGAASSDSTHLTAIGVATGLTTTFEGISVIPSDVLVKYTYYGDANLSGTVDSADYTLIDGAFLNNQNTTSPALTGWQNGDFNYDGVINGSDYTLIDNAFNTQGANIQAQVANPSAQIAAGTSAVPEPTTLGLLGIGITSLLTRRRRQTTNW